MKLERHKGNWSRLPAVIVRTCPYCLEVFETDEPHRRVCGKRGCTRARKREWYRAHRDLAGRPNGHQLSAPALQTACEALEAQLTAENRPQWREIIAAFHVKPVPGYRNLTETARNCVLAKRRLLT